MNAYRPGRSRAREAVAHVRHLFLEEDVDGPGLLAALSTRPDLPPPSPCCIRRLGGYVLWRVRDIAPSESSAAEGARSRTAHGSGRNVVRADHEVAGFFNHKRQPSVRVGIEYSTGETSSWRRICQPSAPGHLRG